jgi:hypothetical protein
METLSRLESQILKMQNELEAFKNFSTQKLELFNQQLPQIKKILNSCGIKEIDTTNCFVDKVITSDESLIFRMYLQADLSNLSDLKKKNLEKKLRDLKIPMPLCPISKKGISFVYS